MILNPNIEIAIQKYIENYLDGNKIRRIKDIIQNFDCSIQITEAEFRNTINNALKTGNLHIIDEKNPYDDSTVILLKPFLFNNEEKVSIVISIPKLRELSIGSIEKRNQQINSIDCFREIIISAKKILRICSPFLQKNVIGEDSFPELRELLLDVVKRNVEIRLLSRELFQGRGEKVQWIIEIAEDLDKIDNLRIVDYHLTSDDGCILSSTHAKLLIADYNMAYVGSAELRKNSLVTNFEVGCLVNGPQVFGICEVFDFMFSHGRVWK